VVASTLTVNREQLGEDAVYFDPHDPDELVTILENYPERNLEEKLYKDYTERVEEAALTLLKIFRNT
jgi:hypothetical protein